MLINAREKQSISSEALGKYKHNGVALLPDTGNYVHREGENVRAIS